MPAIHGRLVMLARGGLTGVSVGTARRGSAGVALEPCGLRAAPRHRPDGREPPEAGIGRICANRLEALLRPEHALPGPAAASRRGIALRSSQACLHSIIRVGVGAAGSLLQPRRASEIVRSSRLKGMR
jgi:hypothetical protein